MSTYNSRDLIYLFLDGEADGMSQNLLFTELAKSSELQQEFQQALEIRGSLQKDKKNLTPPAVLSAAIFTQAGFGGAGFMTQPTAAAPQSVIQPLTAKFTALMSKMAIPLAYAGSGAVVTAILLYKTFSGSADITKYNSNKAKSSKDQAEKVITKIPEVSTGKSLDKVRIKTVTVYRDVPVYINKEEEKTSNNIAQETTQTNIDSTITMHSAGDTGGQKLPFAVSLTLTKPELPSASEFRINRGTPFNEFNPMKPVVLRRDISGTDVNMVLEIRGISGLGYYPYRSIDPEPQTGVNNLSLAISYEPSRNHSLGLAIGKESLQMYTVKESGSEITFEKEPRLIWGGVCYKYKMDGVESLYGISPYVGGTLGWAAYGAIVKGDIGLYYYPSGIFSFALGLEGSSLAYQTRSTIKTTQKLGFVYNMGIHF